MLSSCAFFAPAEALVYSTTFFSKRSYTPTNRSPDPMGHVTGNGCTCHARGTSDRPRMAEACARDKEQSISEMMAFAWDAKT